MAEERNIDKGSKTEQPSTHRQEEARKKGNIAQSRELSHFLVLCAFGGSLWWMGSDIATQFSSLLKPWIANVGQIPCDSNNLYNVLLYGFGSSFQICLWFFIALCGLIFFGSGLQTQFHFTADALAPKLERISLGEGFKRIFSVRNSVEFFKGLGKLGLILCIAIVIFEKSNFPLQHFSSIQIQGILPETGRIIFQIILSLIAAMGILAALDYGYQWIRIFHSLYMSRQEMKDETKDLEGDPHVAFRQRQMQKELAQMRGLPTKIPQATVVITNPTHYAVALRWAPQEMAAPKVIAKGADRVAQRIRELAKENFIPLVENPALARVLYSSVRNDEEILPEHYKAVAEIIRYILRIQNKNKNKM